MIPVGAVVTLAGKSLANAIAKRFSDTVIERWTKYRATQFYQGFLTALAIEMESGVEQCEVDKKLDQILSDETRNELLFDAYRSVCFAKSKSLGPQIIGLLTGALVIEKRRATNEEEQVFQAAEALSDFELLDFF